ncbi:alpha/beta hydrolase [Enteractinococcus fodinae]|uniref:Pimeloyl-ACP methyl ester carboxylesterase n=1 Tax=Enteractinococcus fodinae TaxID=684663 RepID=A0ABU2AXK7_9MICC|nr:alpha/beta hydrolase [Enteractinococcus fodinae]MDR7346087.1 pimeloyl-ACP methyl ester carboxylesterase [Enteractinococcus fodinae]
MDQQLTTEQGDTITFEVRGIGPPLVFIPGAGSFRAIDPTVPPTAKLVATHGVTTVVYDRIGLGESTGSAPVTLAKEISILRAILKHVGGSAALCGHSSGSAIALYAATVGLPVTGLALWEVPLIGPSIEVQSWAADFIELLDASDHAGAVDQFTKDMPPNYQAELRASPIWDLMIANAQSMRADAEALAWFHSAPLQTLIGGLTMPLLTMVGESTFEVMNRATDAIVRAVPHAQQRVVPGAQHEWEVEPMVEELVKFVTAG